MIQKIYDIISLIDAASEIMEADAEWKIKHYLIFGLHIWEKITESGYEFDWYRPDMSYQDDVTAYYDALVDFKHKLLPFQLN